MRARRGLLVLVAVLVACGPDGVDQHRRDTLAMEQIVIVEPPGVVRSGSIEERQPQRNELTLEFGPNRVDRTFEVEFSDKVSLLGFYLDELMADEWVDIDANCQPGSADRTAWASVLAKKRLDGFTATVKVSISYAPDPNSVRITVSAPFHDERGDAPAGAEPEVQADCGSLL